MRLWRCLTILCLLGSLACGAAGMASGGAANAEPHDYSRTAAKLELMQGHLIASLENYKLGQTALAQAHAAHPLHEHYSDLPAAFAKEHAELDNMVRDMLARLPQRLGENIDVNVYASHVREATRLLDQVGTILIPAEIRTTSAFQAAVLAHLLEEVAEEYDEAVEEGKVVNLPEYQDAFGFLQRARRLQEQVAAQMQEGDRQQMQALWNTLEEGIPGIMPPSSPKSARAVAAHVNAMIALFKGI
jgi:hypothetical protein